MGVGSGFVKIERPALGLPQPATVDTQPIPPRTLTAVDELAGLVLGYLRDHPRASDTLQGVAEWWIPRQQIVVDVMNLQRALRALVERGLVEEVGMDGRPRYRLAHPEEAGRGPERAAEGEGSARAGTDDG
ncbi:MAG: hypothetical protein JWM27_1234 [Gemmatimonadetes bacterium]|nr:hypothetical protein [Gemmatimonadota bacterium]